MQFQLPVRPKDKREFSEEVGIGVRQRWASASCDCAESTRADQAPAWLEHANIACFRLRGIGGGMGIISPGGELCEFGFAPERRLRAWQSNKLSSPQRSFDPAIAGLVEVWGLSRLRRALQIWLRSRKRRLRAWQSNKLSSPQRSFDPAIAGLVEVWGFEPQTFSLRTRRSTN